MTYNMQNLLIGKAVLSELGHEQSHFDCVATEQIGEHSEHIHNLVLANLVVHVEQMECFLNWVLEVDAHKFGAVEDQLHCFLGWDTFTLQDWEDWLELLWCLR